VVPGTVPNGYSVGRVGRNEDLKALGKRLVAFAAEHDAVWTALDAVFLRFARYAENERRKRIEVRAHSEIETAVRAICPTLAVMHGPFRGMRYPRARSSGSTLFPKLVGSYERELHPTIERICRRNYSEVIDVGCAEGYYAVGLAMRIPHATVFAYDTDDVAIAQCREMAELNGVSERVVTSGVCDISTLRTFFFHRTGLVISDCEGFEKTLFSEEVVSHLEGHDVLIETHDFIDIEISSLLRQRFEAHHRVTAIRSVDDIEKAHTYSYDELRSYDLSAREKLLAEGRPAIMEWLLMTPRSSDAGSAVDDKTRSVLSRDEV
jgi:hypothetical protein